MGSRVIGVGCLIALLLAIPGISKASYDYELGDWGKLNIKGDVTYGFKIRTEEPKPDWLNLSRGNSNFEKKGDVTSNNFIATGEYNLDTKHFTLYGRVVGRVDLVYFDDEKFTAEQEEHAGYNITDGSEFFLEGRFGKFTTRWGRHVVQWGENLAAVFTGVNEVSPMALGLLDTAGNPPRSSQVPTYLAWSSFRITDDVSIEGVWQPDFDPRYWFAVPGTFGSSSDLLGWDADTRLPIIPALGVYADVLDRRPEDFEDMQQYGGAMRVIIPQLNLLELGFYYYHYRSRTPLATMENTLRMLPIAPFPIPLPSALIFEWPENDLFGMSFNQAIQTILGYNFDWTISGELVWRPRDPLQLRDSAGYERFDTLAWNIQFWKMMPNLMPFTPWNVTLNPMIEFNGKSILEHEERLVPEPKLTANYWVMLPLTIDGMIDNVKLDLTVMARGGMQDQMASGVNNSRHALGFSLGAKYGNLWTAKVGYTLTTVSEGDDNGNNDPEQYDMTGSSRADRDAFNFNVTVFW